MLLLGVLAAPVRAEGIEVRSATLEAAEEAYELSASFEIVLSPALLEALLRGVPLYFVADVHITRARWYWFDEVVVSQEFGHRLSYNALTRHYRVASGALFQNFETLEEALSVVSHLTRRAVAERNALNKGEEYTVAVRMRLDTSQLPKPFQVNALTSRDWNLSSDWERWKLTP